MNELVQTTVKKRAVTVESLKELEEKPWVASFQHLKIEDATNLIDVYFPKRDKNNKPSYRKNQREAIESILRSYITERVRFVVLDAPVGSGKSAINYTVSRILGPALYITSQKMLQDQIVDDNFDSSSSIKGNSESLCTYAYVRYEKEDVRSNNSNRKYKMCDTMDNPMSYDKGSITPRTVAKAIWITAQHYNDAVKEDPSIPRQRFTNFSSMEIDEIQDMLISMHLSDPLSRVISTNIDDDGGSCSSESNLEFGDWALKNLVCSIKGKVELVECPRKSGKTVLRTKDVRILNPDVFHYHKNTAAFPKNDNIVVIDEAHCMEDAMVRIFSSPVPTQTFEKVFFSPGLHSRALKAATPNLFREFVNSDLGAKIAPLFEMAWMMTDLKKLAHQMETGEYMSDAGGPYIAILQKYTHQYVSLSDAILNPAFDDAIMEVNAKFQNMKEKTQNPDKPEPTEDTWYGTVLGKSQFHKYHVFTAPQKRLIKDFLKKLNIAHCGGPDAKDTLALVALADIADDIERFKYIGAAANIVDSQKRPQFVIRCNENRYANYREDWKIMDFLDAEKMREWFDIVPINTAALLNQHFYSRYGDQKIVLLSSGTWVNPEVQLRRLGVAKGNCRIVKVDTTFPAKSRRILCYPVMDFSAKLEGTYQYEYKSGDGLLQWTYAIDNTVAWIRKQYGDVNIAIHTNSFDIGKLIAENCAITKRWAFHLNARDPIFNRPMGIQAKVADKNKMINYAMSNPDSGLVMISPSIKEGVDFRHGICRAQIIVKAPIPNFGDPYIKAMANGEKECGVIHDPDYMDTKVMMDTTQMYGRVMRSQDDWGVTIVIDKKLIGIMEKCAANTRSYNIDYLADGLDFRLVRVNDRISLKKILNWAPGK